MKIVMVTSSAFPFHNSGVAYVVHNMAKELTKMGHEVLVVGLDFNAKSPRQQVTDISYDGYKVKGLTLPGVASNFNNTFAEKDYNNPVAAKMLEELLRDSEPDIVHFHTLQSLGAGSVKKAKQLGYKTVVTMHDWWWLCPFSFMANSQHTPCNQLKINKDTCRTCVYSAEIPHEDDFITKRETYLKQILAQDTDLIIPVSDYVKSYLEPNGINMEKVITIPNGVEPYNQIGDRPVDTNQKSNLNTGHDKIRFGFLGGKHELKGYDLLIEACQGLNDTNYDLHIYGILQLNTGLIKKVIDYLKSGNIKELWRKVKRHFPKNKKRGSPITYYPLFKPEEKDQAYEKIDILLSLSKVKESSSLVVREALVRGIPVITTPSGGPEEVIVNGGNGIILKESTPEQLKDAMEQMIRSDSLKKMKDYIKKNPYTYTYKDQARLLIDLYEKPMIGEKQ